MVHNIQKGGKTLYKKMLLEDADLKSSIEKCDHNRISYVFYVILNNILHSLRVLRADRMTALASLNLKECPEKIHAYRCIKAIISIFPEIKKM